MTNYLLLATLVVVGHLNTAFANEMNLAARWESIKRTSESSLNLWPHLKDKHVIFVAGIMNELAAIISSYFVDNAEAVEEFGATASVIGPPSSNSIPQNAEILYERVWADFLEFGEKKILVGHSKGGAELLYLILQHPELILNGVVEYVVLIQPAIGGSPLAESFGFGVDLVSLLLGPNLETLSTGEAKLQFDEAFDDFHDALREFAGEGNIEDLEKEVSRRIFYVRSQQRADQLSLGTNIVLGVWQDELPTSMANDGLLLVEAQMDQRIGVDLGVLESDHLGLTVSKVSNVSKHDRKAVTWAIFEQIISELRSKN